jgi:hypothetical protein
VRLDFASEPAFPKSVFPTLLQSWTLVGHAYRRRWRNLAEL